jgi:hypothetical protein
MMRLMMMVDDDVCRWLMDMSMMRVDDDDGDGC